MIYLMDTESSNPLDALRLKSKTWGKDRISLRHIRARCIYSRINVLRTSDGSEAMGLLEYMGVLFGISRYPGWNIQVWSKHPWFGITWGRN